MKKNKLLLIALSLLCLNTIKGQITTEDVLDHIGASIDLRTAHYSNGIVVTDEVYTASDIHFKTKNNAFRVGMWGGFSINGDFTEFDYYVSYTTGGFTFSVWDIYDFSPDRPYNNRQAFNYKARETGHFVEASVDYQMPKKFPLKVHYSTIVYGRDRDALNKKNVYTSVIRLEYPVIDVDGFKLDASIGGVYAYRSRQTLYSKTGGITDIRLRLSKDIKIGNYKLPIYIVPLWNPQANLVHVQVGVTLFSL